MMFLMLLARFDEHDADDPFPDWMPLWLLPLIWLVVSITLMIVGSVMMRRENKDE